MLAPESGTTELEAPFYLQPKRIRVRLTVAFPENR